MLRSCRTRCMHAAASRQKNETVHAMPRTMALSASPKVLAHIGGYEGMPTSALCCSDGSPIVGRRLRQLLASCHATVGGRRCAAGTSCDRSGMGSQLLEGLPHAAHERRQGRGLAGPGMVQAPEQSLEAARGQLRLTRRDLVVGADGQHEGELGVEVGLVNERVGEAHRLRRHPRQLQAQARLEETQETIHLGEALGSGSALLRQSLLLLADVLDALLLQGPELVPCLSR
mmetsp:Transcript_51840/g.166938  ORF Transcript_51840/g.166938 Transcript_51840/m.166938 type:complete len:230 (+) Transcript_51840:107-796(+)